MTARLQKGRSSHALQKGVAARLQKGAAARLQKGRSSPATKGDSIPATNGPWQSSYTEGQSGCKRTMSVRLLRGWRMPLPSCTRGAAAGCIVHKGRGYQNADLNDKKGNQWQAVGFFAEVCSDSNANDNNITGC